MSELRCLLKLELRSLYGINKFLNNKDGKAKKRYASLLWAWGGLILVGFALVAGLVYGLCTLGLAKVVPSYLVVMSTLLILIFGIFKAGSRIFGQKGYDILASMPVRSNSIVVSRFVALYVEDLVFAGLIMLPGIVTYGIMVQPNFSFYLLAFVGVVFLPAIPLVLSTLFGTIVYAITSRIKSKNVTRNLLSVVLTLGLMSLSFIIQTAIQNASAEELTDFAKMIAKSIEGIYLPAAWFSSAVVEYNLLGLVLFVGVSALSCIAIVCIVSKSFHAIVRRLLNFSAKHNYKMSKLESKSFLKTLYFKERKRYFSSSVYVTNTIIGPILGTVMAIALCFMDVRGLQKVLPLDVDLVSLLPVLVGLVFCMMTTSSVSISMEGKQFWIVKTMPIETKTWLDSKILFNLSLMFPFYVASCVALIIASAPNVLQLFNIFLFTAALILFVVVFGITINLASYNFEWEREESVVKQSLPAMVGGFIGPVLCILLGVGLFFVPSRFSAIVILGVSVILFAVTAILYKANNKKRISEL